MNPVDYISMNENCLWECDICSKTEFDNSKIKKHIRKQHEDLEKEEQASLIEVISQ